MNTHTYTHTDLSLSKFFCNWPFFHSYSGNNWSKFLKIACSSCRLINTAEVLMETEGIGNTHPTTLCFPQVSWSTKWLTNEAAPSMMNGTLMPVPSPAAFRPLFIFHPDGTGRNEMAWVAGYSSRQHTHKWSPDLTRYTVILCIMSLPLAETVIMQIKKKCNIGYRYRTNMATSKPTSAVFRMSVNWHSYGFHFPAQHIHHYKTSPHKESDNSLVSFSSV